MSFDFFKLQFENQGRGDQLAVVGREARYSWRELETRVLRLVELLRATEIPKGHPVIIRGQKEADFVTSILACMICELPYIPLDRVFPEDRVRKIQSILGAQVLIQCGEPEPFEFAFEVNARTLALTEKKSKTPLAAMYASVDPLVYVIFTSGSTGEPKGVEITRSNVHDLLRWILSSDFAFGQQDVFINQCSFSFDVSFFDLLASLQSGATLILNSPEQIKAPDEFTGRLAPLNPSVWVSTPSFLSLALLNRDFNAQVLPRLNKFYLAGETLHPSLVQRVFEKFPEAHVYNAYGPTEATVIVTLVDVTREMLAQHPNLPIGVVKAGSRIDLINTFKQDGETVGELVIVGENVARGYFGRPDLTAQKFTQVDGKPAYRTGDHGYYKGDLLFFLGRIDNQIKLHGFRIEIDEIDAHIMNVPEVELSVTVPLVRDGDVKKLVSFFKIKKQISESEAVSKIRQHLETKVPYYMIPTGFKLVEDFPYSASHKIDKKQLLHLLQF